MGREDVDTNAHVKQHNHQVGHVDAAAHAAPVLLQLVLAVTVLVGILLLFDVNLDFIYVSVSVIG